MDFLPFSTGLFPVIAGLNQKELPPFLFPKKIPQNHFFT
jgi:hypothetical protein